jgi:hypothetical protein
VDEPSLAQRVAALLPAEARCLVVEDSAHVYETTFCSPDDLCAVRPSRRLLRSGRRLRRRRGDATLERLASRRAPCLARLAEDTRGPRLPRLSRAGALWDVLSSEGFLQRLP